MKDITNTEREWETVWEVFSELSKNLRKPATIPPSSSSTSYTNISSTTHDSIFPTSCITTSHTHLRTTDYLHHTTTSFSTTTSITTLAPIIFQKQSRPRKTKKSARTTFTTSPTTTSTPSSITTPTPTIFPKQSRPKKTKISTQIIIPRRHATTLNTFVSTDIRLNHYKISLPHSNTTGLASQYTPPQKPHPTRRCKPLLNSPTPPLLNTPLPPLSSTPPLPPLASTPPPPHKQKFLPS